MISPLVGRTGAFGSRGLYGDLQGPVEEDEPRRDEADLAESNADAADVELNEDEVDVDDDVALGACFCPPLPMVSMDGWMDGWMDGCTDAVRNRRALRK